MSGRITPLSLNDLSKDYDKLCDVSLDPNGKVARWRGYQFERLLKALLEREGLEPRSSYKKKGEQIDGSFMIGNSTYLVEAKWHATPLSASELYQFKGKVDGKLVGTIGVFISMSGYSDDAVDALVLGKTINVILFDRSDIDEAFRDGAQFLFKKILRRKLRSASEEGLPFFPMSKTVVTGDASVSVEIGKGSPSKLTIVCEGETDRKAIEFLVQRVLKDSRGEQSIEILISRGKQSLAKVVNALGASRRPNARILIVVDGDGDPKGALNMLRNTVEIRDWTAVAPDPGIEVWFGLAPLRMRRQDGIMGLLKEYEDAAKVIDLHDLIAKDDAFSVFHHLVAGLKPRNRKKLPR